MPPPEPASLAGAPAGPSLGVVIPVRDGRRWIGQALASVASQSHPVDAVVVVDDGSSDDTIGVVERWSGLLPLTVVATEGGVGPGPARALGIDRLPTTLVALLDADDVWLPDHVALMTAQWRRCRGLVTADAWRWVEGEAIGTTPWSRRFPVPPPTRQLARLIEGNFVFIGTVFSRSLYDRSGGFRDVWGAEDWDLWLRMAAAGGVISRPAAPTVLYRVRPGGITGSGRLPAAELDATERFLAGSCPPGLRRLALQRRQRCLAALALQEGYEDARHGQASASRRAALRAVRRGGSRVRGISLAMAVAPRLVVAHRDRRHADPRWLLGQ